MGPAIPSPLRKLAIAGFFACHVGATTWWCFGVFGLPERQAEVWPSVTEPLRQAGRGLERRLVVIDRPARAWVNLTASWQNWEMFAEPARQRGEVELQGVERFVRGRPVPAERAVLDPADERYESWFLRNSAPPCGFRARGDAARDREFLTRYVDYHLFRHELETGERFVGARYLCRLEPLPDPETSMAEGEVETIVLWESRP